MQDYLEAITDLREHDVPYHVRFSIDTDVRAGQWFQVSGEAGACADEASSARQRSCASFRALDIMRGDPLPQVSAHGGRAVLKPLPEMKRMAEPTICAFDIETTKLPLQFPNSEYDQVRLGVRRKARKTGVATVFGASLARKTGVATVFLARKTGVATVLGPLGPKGNLMAARESLLTRVLSRCCQIATCVVPCLFWCAARRKAETGQGGEIH